MTTAGDLSIKAAAAASVPDLARTPSNHGSAKAAAPELAELHELHVAHMSRIESAAPEVLLELARGELVRDDEMPPMDISDDDDRRVRRKIDRVLIPLMMVAYTLQYVDRSSMSYAAIFKFRTDLHLDANGYAWLGSCYYIGYLFFEFPGALLLQRLPLSKTLGVLILAWGALLVASFFPRSFAPMAAIRTLLGASEALVTPGFVLLVSRFYRRAEQPLRVGMWYACNGLGNFVGGMVSYGMGRVEVGNVPDWAWIFMFNGIATLVYGVVFLLLCPESPTTWSRLTPHERRVALERVRGNKASLQSRRVKWDQVAEALLPWRDPQGWAYFLIVACICLPNGGIANFLHLILQAYGYTTFQTILIGLPSAALQIIFPLSGAYIARRWPGWRCWVMILYILPSLLGAVLQYIDSTSRPWKLFGYYLLSSYVCSLSLCFAAPGANVAGYTKRVTVSAQIFVAYALGNICGPQLFISTEDPPYHTGMLACIVCFSAALPLVAGLRWWYARANRLKAERSRARGEEYMEGKGNFADLTDCQNDQFRYAL